MYPHERARVEEMKDKPFALIGVNSDQTVERAKEAIAKNKLNWRSFQNKGQGARSPRTGPSKVGRPWSSWMRT